MGGTGRGIGQGMAALLLTTALISCSSGGGGGGTPASREWTYMVYMGADNNLSTAGLGDLNEMESVGSTGAVSIVLQAEFSQRYSAGLPTTDTLRFLVQRDNNPNSVNLGAGASIGNVNMGIPATLTAFIQWAKNAYPAKHYALVIWDHGSGWKDRQKSLSQPLRGAVQDETSGSFMSLPDLAAAVSASGVHFDVINFDACLMAMYEVAYEFRGLTDYMVFSEQTEPGEGDPYDTILAALVASPGMSSQTLAGTIVDKYNAYYTTAGGQQGGTTKSAVNMANLAALDTKLLALVTALQSDPTSTAVMTTARSTTQEYAYTANHDIWHLSDHLVTSAAGAAVKTAAAEVKTAIQAFVINNKITGAAVADSHGLAIYLPLDSETNATELASYAVLDCNLTRAAAAGTWGAYLDTLLTGGGTATYSDGNFGLYTAWTNSSDLPCDADLDLYVMEPSQDIFAPWMGQTTPNGFFSLDSYDSGVSEEYYLANAQVVSGDYYFLINYYAHGATCTEAKARLYIYDPANFLDTDWHEATVAELGPLTDPSPQLLDLSSPWTGQPLGTPFDLNNYSDWWVPFGFTPRSLGASPFVISNSLPNITKSSQLVLKYKKGSRFLGAVP